MFVRYYVDLAEPFAEVESRLLREPERWLPGLLVGAEDRGTRLLAEVGFVLGGERRVGKRVEVRVGDAHRMPGKTMLPITWTATGEQRLFPSLEGDLELAAVGEHRCQVSMSARYYPPLGTVGRILDRALFHRVAEATVKDFLDRVVEQINGASAVPPA